MNPLISCIMPTCDRPQFIGQAIKYFQWQDYPNKELIIVDNGSEKVKSLLPDDNRVRYISVDGEALTVGTLRNIATSAARGQIIAHFDDDDFFSSHRLSTQVKPLLSGIAEVSGLRMDYMLSIADGILWQCSPRVHAALFQYGIRCGTLMYYRNYWKNGVVYEDLSRGEDVRLLEAMLNHGARLAALVEPADYICIRHGSNVSASIDGVGMAGWTQVSLFDHLKRDDVSFYLRLR